MVDIIADARLDRMDQQGGIIELIAMTNAIGDSLWRERFSALLVGLFAGLAALIAAGGLYAVVSHTVVRRTQEIASRFQRNLAASRQLDLSSAPQSDDVLVTLRRVPVPNLTARCAGKLQTFATRINAMRKLTARGTTIGFPTDYGSG